MTSTPRSSNGHEATTDPCVEAEILATYIDGGGTAGERARVESHLARCEDCYGVFVGCFLPHRSAEVEPAMSGGVRSGWADAAWSRRAAAVFAVAAAALVVVYVGQQARPGDPLRAALTQLEAASGPYRRFAPRLSNGDAYRAQAAPLRSASPTDNLPLELRRAALQVEHTATSYAQGERERRALAAMYFALGRAESAAAILTPISSTTDPAAMNDLAATLLARDADGDATHALTLLERVVARDPNRAEAWFNLGLAASAAGVPTRAREAWTRYLELDTRSPWATEVREHLQKLR
jgi:tetratricopeptide (TPR) repeat protein